MRILGIDPGLTRLGYGVIDTGIARAVSLVQVGVVRTAATIDPARRLLKVYTELTKIVQDLAPQVMSVERVFAVNNMRSVTGTAQAAGVALLVAAQHNLPVALHSPSEVKAAVSGNGTADKKQVQLMVQKIIGLSQIISPPDAADALALAICQAWRGGGRGEAARAQYGGAKTRQNMADFTPAQQRWIQAERQANKVTTRLKNK